MPIYEYACRDCHGTFEALTSYGEREARRACPRCASEAVKPLVSRVAMLSRQDSTARSGACGCGGNCACAAN
jgi:putative FmdB family regulatory protein